MATILIRADASPAMGTGHLMRCFAVAEALAEDGHRPVFAMVQGAEVVSERLVGAGFECRTLPGSAGDDGDLAATRRLLDTLGADAVILDGYHFNDAYRAGLKATGRRVLAFDDLANLPALHADVVVNPAPQARADTYRHLASGALLLLGPRYAALRREIRAAATAPRPDVGELRTILVTFGGSDPLGLTGPCIAALAPRLPAGCRLNVAVGGSDPRADAVAAMAARMPEVAVHRDTPHMGALMAEAGLAISAGGGTTAELAALGVPTLLVVVADNQAPAAVEAAALEWCAVLDARGDDHAGVIATRALALWRDVELRRAMSARAAGLVDGEGAVRIARALTQGLHPPS